MDIWFVFLIQMSRSWRFAVGWKLSNYTLLAIQFKPPFHCHQITDSEAIPIKTSFLLSHTNYLTNEIAHSSCLLVLTVVSHVLCVLLLFCSFCDSNMTTHKKSFCFVCFVFVWNCWLWMLLIVCVFTCEGQFRDSTHSRQPPNRNPTNNKQNDTSTIWNKQTTNQTDKHHKLVDFAIAVVTTANPAQQFRPNNNNTTLSTVTKRRTRLSNQSKTNKIACISSCCLQLSSKLTIVTNTT